MQGIHLKNQSDFRAIISYREWKCETCEIMKTNCQYAAKDENNFAQSYYIE